MKSYFVLKTFEGVLGSHAAGTIAKFGDGSAAIMRNAGVICPVDGPEHAAFLANTDEPTLETKPALEVALETKPAPRAKKGK